MIGPRPNSHRAALCDYVRAYGPVHTSQVQAAFPNRTPAAVNHDLAACEARGWLVRPLHGFYAAPGYEERAVVVPVPVLRVVA